MKKQYIDVQSYFQDWTQAKKKEVQKMEKSMREKSVISEGSKPNG